MMKMPMDSQISEIAPATYRVDFKAMGCRCELVIGHPNVAVASEVASAAIAEVRRIEQTYSRYQPDSVVSRINQAAGEEPVDCDVETLALLRYADMLFTESDGAFDITSGVLRRVWNFNHAQLPPDAELQACLTRVGWQHVELTENTVRLALPGMEIDFGGFGKEYAVDRAASVLLANDIQHGYVNLGGDLSVIGPKLDGSPWVMGIQHPRLPDGLLASIPMERGALASSGDYERFFELAGKRYCHVLSPATGYPVNEWQSVSVLAPLCVTAGSFSTIAMLKGLDAPAWLSAQGLRYLAMDHTGKLHMAGESAPQSQHEQNVSGE
jgi:FAD:protein FMN transferase